MGRGERFPFVEPDATAFFEGGDELPHSDEEIFASVIYGVSFIERLAFESIAARGYDTATAISFTGGGSRNERWNAIRATVLGREVRVPVEAEGAIGMAVLAAAALDESAEGNRMTRAAHRLLGGSSVVEPAGRDEELEDAYERFRSQLSSRGWI